MIVIAVIVILSALLLPAINQARGTARATMCRSNLRALTLAALDYTQAFDHAPAAVWRKEGPNSGITTMQWDWMVQPNGTYEIGVVGQRLDRPISDFSCPLWTESQPEEESGEPPFTGYNYNTSFIGGEAPFPAIGFNAVRVGVAPSGWQHTDTTMFGIGGWSGGTNRYMRAPGNHEFVGGATCCAGAQSFRHIGDRTHFSRLDGSVGISAMPSNGGHDQGYAATILDHPNNGFLSDDDRAYDPGPR